MKKTLFTTLLLAATAVMTVSAQQIEVKEWTLGDSVRKATIVVPKNAKTEASPVIFVFHGRGESMQDAAKMQIEKLWPEAIVIYPQGLYEKNKGMLGAGYGWERPGKDTPGRDMPLFNKILEYIGKEYKVDAGRTYGIGITNGGGFLYGQWIRKPETMTAIAVINMAIDKADFLKNITVPKPIFLVAAKNDKVLKFAWQTQFLNRFIALNKCDKNGDVKGDKTTYKSPSGVDVVTYYYEGDAASFPPAVIPDIVAFFKNHSKK